MGLFSRKSTPCEAPMLPGIEVVDETHYQDKLSAVAANLLSGYGDLGGARPAIPVTIQLRRNPKDRHDPTTVECLLDGLVIGRLNPEAAAQLQDFLRECEERHQRAELRGFLEGGTADKDGIRSDWVVKPA
jgi:hypothetical protein